MDPLQSHHTAFPRAAGVVPVTSFQQNYADSNSSSPLCRPDNTRDGTLPPVPDSKLRLMCSYGGHFIPRPHDKSLCYVGGDTRIVAVDRQSSLADVHARLSHILLNGHHFTFKYQLPNKDLESLVSVSTGEDLAKMIEEYDQTMLAYSPLKPCRLRLFLFQAKLDTSASMGSLLDDDKSETWFLDTFNNTGLLTGRLSESAEAQNLLELENNIQFVSSVELKAQNDSLTKNSIQEVCVTMPDEPTVETTSSYESSISSQSLGNLPPVTDKVEDNHMNATFQDQNLGLDEQFLHMNVASNAQNLNAAPALPTVTGNTGTLSSAGVVISAAANDDDKSGHCVSVRLRKPPLSLLSIQRKTGDAYSLPSPDSKRARDNNLTSPDSVASDNNIASAMSPSKLLIYQHATSVTSGENDPKNNLMEPSSQILMQQVQDSVVIPAPPENQQQRQNPVSIDYIQHTAKGPPTVPSYYPIYTTPSVQPLHQRMDQQYQIYLIPVHQTQSYNMTVQSDSITDPETAANVYRTVTPATPRTVQVHANQFQQQHYGLFQVPPSQSFAADSTTNANFFYEYSPAPPHPSQYQTTSPITTATLFSRPSAQLGSENTTSESTTS